MLLLTVSSLEEKVKIQKVRGTVLALKVMLWYSLFQVFHLTMEFLFAPCAFLLRDLSESNLFSFQEPLLISTPFQPLLSSTNYRGINDSKFIIKKWVKEVVVFSPEMSLKAFPALCMLTYMLGYSGNSFYFQADLLLKPNNYNYFPICDAFDNIVKLYLRRMLLMSFE